VNLSYLVDTDWLVDHLGGDLKTTRKLEKLEPSGIAMGIISLAELCEGVYCSQDPEESQRGTPLPVCAWRVRMA
jgi:predicted nucleic acid-binding protein